MKKYASILFLSLPLVFILVFVLTILPSILQQRNETKVVTLPYIFNEEEIPLQRKITLNPWTYIGINNEKLKKLILVEDGRETTLLQDLPPEGESFDNRLSINEVFHTNNPDYFVYITFEWIGDSGYTNNYLYDLKNRRTIDNLINPINGQFIKNNTFFLTCQPGDGVGPEGIFTQPEVHIYTVPDFTLHKQIDLDLPTTLVHCGSFNDQDNTLEISTTHRPPSRTVKIDI
jgi:hypothetical protein